MSVTTDSVHNTSGESPRLTPDDAIQRKLLRRLTWMFGPIGLLVLSAALAARWYQQWAGWVYGLDATTSEFGAYWMSLFYAEAVIFPLLCAATWGGLWLTRDRRLAELAPQDEFYRYGKWIGLIAAYVLAFVATVAFAEGDAAWHQTVVRDTSFTPSHIVLFYGGFPTFIWLGGTVFFYSITRLPIYAKRLSVPVLIAVVGPFLMLPNVAYNEWGHAFWNSEEIFSLPLHWGFVVFGWSVLALGGVFVQVLNRLVALWPEVFPEDDNNAPTAAGR